MGLNIYQEKLDLNMPYVAEMVRSTLVDRYGEAVMDSGWRVQTTINSSSQLAANAALVGGLRDYDRRHGWRGVEAESGSLEGRKILIIFILPKLLRFITKALKLSFNLEKP